MIIIDNLSKSYNDNYLFSDVNISIKRGMKIGLVGANGTGKTTLLRILMGHEDFDSGNVQIDKKISIGYLPQELKIVSNSTILEEAQKSFSHLKKIEQELNDLNTELKTDSNNEKTLKRIGVLQHKFEVLGGWSIETNAKKILDGLGFKKNQFNEKITTLSGGWIMRVALASILLQDPDIIILDEPTNHLDLDSTIWLENFLSKWNGSLVLISHDRTFLDKVINYILEIELKKIFLFKGNYSDYTDQKSARIEQHKSSYKNQQKQIKETEKFIERFRYKSTKASQVQSRIKTLEKLEKIGEPAKENRSLNLLIPTKTRSPLKLISCESVKKTYGQNVVFETLNLVLERDQKIALIGHNGAGKSTLLKLLAKEIEPTSGNIKMGPDVEFAYYAQHQLEILRKEETVYKEIESVGSGIGDTEIKKYLGMFLFTGEDTEKKINILSGGEKARVALAKMLLSPVDILLLDEPTNHLDIKARAILEQALKNYKGAIVCISHDRHFLNTVTNTTINIGRTGLKIYHGNYDYFLWKKEKDQKCIPKFKEVNQTSLYKNTEFKAKKKAKNRDTWIGRRITKINTEIDKARALLQDKANQDNYQLLVKETEKIDSLEIEYLELLEEREIIRSKN